MTRWRARRFSPSAKSPAARPRRASSLAAALTLEDIERIAGASIETADELSFDRASASLRARRRRRLGALILAEQTLPVPQDDAAALALARGVLSLGVARLPWTKALKQRRDRVMFLRRAEGEAWPDLSDEALGRRPRLARAVPRSARRSSTRSAPTISPSALDAALPWDLARRLDRRGADPFPGADRDCGADRLRSRGRSGDRAARAGAVRSRRASVAGRRAAFRSPSICSRPPTARSRSRATCRASGAAPGPPCAPTFAAAIPAISGRRTPPPPRRRPERSRGGREARRPRRRKPPVRDANCANVKEREGKVDYLASNGNCRPRIWQRGEALSGADRPFCSTKR